MKTLDKCIGFPRGHLCGAPPDSPSGFWCAECEKKRRTYLDQCFREVSKMYGIDYDAFMREES